ncbi:hypothetical protein SCA03_08820 [Streptomyces cacaoi]|uniref:Uncharacterized protein n=1 Tax=Streptomyces cacaoi TaxID=1898 RepID=A0A4Y3QSY3_STRCI|nr:hypothetical protein SCA03_08820 [Streptomyces cacaoi]
MNEKARRKGCAWSYDVRPVQPPRRRNGLSVTDRAVEAVAADLGRTCGRGPAARGAVTCITASSRKLEHLSAPAPFDPCRAHPEFTRNPEPAAQLVSPPD